MSNTPNASPTVIRLPQAALIFVLLITALGALLMVSNNIDPKAGVRASFTATPSPTPDLYSDAQYTAWKSPDGVLELEHPSSWQTRANQQISPFQYVIASPESTGTGFVLLALPISQLGQTGLVPNASLEDVMKVVFADITSEDLKPTTIGSLSGLALLQTDTAQNFQREWRFVKLDDQNLLILQSLAEPSNWDKMQPIADRVAASIKVNTSAVVSQLNAAFTPETPVPSVEVTAAPVETPASTPISEPTAEPTAVPTQSN
ncbi:MAG: hypothetical protein IT322_16720 [Anaerolineae bacterium]|nr:hypothetical protein [Anaerolineae bacterium]